MLCYFLSGTEADVRFAVIVQSGILLLVRRKGKWLTLPRRHVIIYPQNRILSYQERLRDWPYEARQPVLNSKRCQIQRRSDPPEDENNINSSQDEFFVIGISDRLEDRAE